jgi:RNA polymerase sigma-70 factor (ECF subfamily)
MNAGERDTHSAQSWALIAAAQAGDRDAFGQLYTRYQPLITRYIQRRVPHRATAEDLTSDTFVKALRGLGSVSRQSADPGAWLTRIARNVVFDHAKSHRVRREQYTDQLPEPRTPGDHAEDGPEAQALTAQRHATVRAVVAQAMAGLTPDQRQALALYEQAPQRGHTGVGEAMGRSVGAVKALRSRALATVRTALSDQGLTSSAQIADDLAAPAARARVERARCATHSHHRDQPGLGQDSGQLAEQAQHWAQRADLDGEHVDALDVELAVA